MVFILFSNSNRKQYLHNILAEHSQALKWFAKVTNSQSTPVADYKWTPMEFVTAEQFVNTIRDASKNAPAPLHTTTPTPVQLHPTAPVTPTSAQTPSIPTTPASSSDVTK